MSDNKTYTTYVENMDKLLELYDEGRQADAMKYEDCGGKLNSCSVKTSAFPSPVPDHHDVTGLSLSAAPRRLSPVVHRPRVRGERQGPEEGLPLQPLSAGQLLGARRQNLRIQGGQAVPHRQTQQDRQLQTTGGFYCFG